MTDFSNPKLTAFALGELSGAELLEMEKLYASNSEVKNLVDEIRSLAGDLKKSFAREATPGLESTRWARIQEQATIKKSPNRFSAWRPVLVAATLAAIVIGLRSLGELPGLKTESGGETIISQNTPHEPKKILATKISKTGLVGTPQSPLLIQDQAGADVTSASYSMPRPTPGVLNEKDKEDDFVFQPRPVGDFNTEGYDRVNDNPFFTVKDAPLSTFSIDVDTASYANIRRFLTAGQVPPKDAVRIEEMLNAFVYDDPTPKDDKLFAVNVSASEAPWTPNHRLVRIGIKGKEIPVSERPAANLVFLIDVSGSMGEPNKLPLLQRAFKFLTDQLSENDHVAIVTYAGNSGLVLPSTSGAEKAKFRTALDRLTSGGSTNGASGIELAYDTAAKNFVKGGINRVILATDGDFNVGTTNQGDLTRLIEEKAKSGVFLSVLGFGMGNYKDSTLEKLSDKGNGNYAYIDTFDEARRAFGTALMGTLMTIAKDVKIQVEFNPALVAGYRLIGYENRMLQAQDFNNDKIDAGEIGAGHSVSALYEIVPVGQKIPGGSVDPLKYQKPAAVQKNESVDSATASTELLTVKLRYKQPDGNVSQLITVPFSDAGQKIADASSELKFATAVAEFGMLLHDSPEKGDASIANVLELAQPSLGKDPEGARAEFLSLVHKYERLSVNPEK